MDRLAMSVSGGCRCGLLYRMPQEAQTVPGGGAGTIGAWPADSELIVGLVAPIGVDLSAVSGTLTEALTSVEYRTAEVRVTDVLRGLGGDFAEVPDSPLDDRYHRLMDLGNALRKKVGSAAAMAMLGVWGIGAARNEAEGSGAHRQAFILRQLKRPEEVAALRRIYGENFVLVAAYTREEERASTLATAIAQSKNDMDASGYREAAYALLQRDEREEDENGQQLRDTFWRADLFVDPHDREKMRGEVRRFVELLFGRRISTPTRDEFAMFEAWASAMRSGSLARQVGSVIYDDKGSLLASGTNDVPRYGGGLYWEGDPDDKRDHQLGQDASDLRRAQMVAQLLEELAKAGWLSDEIRSVPFRELSQRALGLGGPLSGSRVAAVMEYVRAAHAEQSAITDAARRGSAVEGAQMAVTTFPCHECARLIVAAGIERVCYVEPYPKSLAATMYEDSIAVGTPAASKVLFEPFLGVAPRIYARVFSAEDQMRKQSDGTLNIPSPGEAQLRLTYGGSRLLLDDAEDAFTAPLTLLGG